MEADDANSAMDIGAASHALFLENDISRFVMVEADDWRTKAAKEQRDAAHAEGKIPLLEHQGAKVRAIAHASHKAVSSCDELTEIFDGAMIEQVCLWQEGDDWCRARPDLVSADRKVVINYKTTGASAAPSSFGSTIVKSGYHVQAYHHARGIMAETGVMPTYLWLAQETDPPYAASILGASPALMELAAMQWRYAIELWRNCLASNEWPAYPSRVCWVEPKSWDVENFMARPDVQVVQSDLVTCQCMTESGVCGSREGVTDSNGVWVCTKHVKTLEEIFG